ncbi:MAG: hypothetical protein AB8B94_19720 [Hyphomicrobiales bacterium]
MRAGLLDQKSQPICATLQLTKDQGEIFTNPASFDVYDKAHRTMTTRGAIALRPCSQNHVNLNDAQAKAASKIRENSEHQINTKKMVTIVMHFVM